MGTISDFYTKHGMAGLRSLAEKVGTKPSYLAQLFYTPSKRPSLEMAVKLVNATDGELTYEGLANPAPRPSSGSRGAE